MSRVAIVYDPVFLEHDTGGQPECAQRLISIVVNLKKAPFAGELSWIKPRPATKSEIELVHTADYIGRIEHDIKSGAPMLDADTPVCQKSWDAAIMAAGAGIIAVDAIMACEYDKAFLCVRPPGHHAEAARAMGFCVFNNVAIAAKHSVKNHRLNKVAIVDFDVHHGNGTQNSFYHDPSVYFISTHQEHHYPGTGHKEETGAGEAQGTNMNFPLPSGTGDMEILSIFDEKIVPALREFAPEFIFVSAGFDAHTDDPLAGLDFTQAGYSGMTERLVELADEVCEGRMISTLEGGYNIEALSRSVEAHVGEMVRGV